jgi:protein farnesyltransferase subunit beta
MPLPILKEYPIDGYPTATSKEQAETEQVLLKHQPLVDPDDPDAAGDSDEALVQKKFHLSYVVRNLVQGFPSRYASQDVSQPWLMYYTLQSLSLLQTELDKGNRQRYALCPCIPVHNSSSMQGHRHDHAMAAS